MRFCFCRERQRLSVLQRLLESLQSLSALTASAPALLQLGELRTAALLLQNALELASPQMLRIKAARALRAKAEGTRAILSAPSLDSLRPEATRVASREAALESGLFSAEEQRLLLAEVRRNFAQRTLRFFGEGNSQSTSSPKSSGRSLEDCLPFVLFSKTQGLVATADSSAALHGGSLDSASPRLCVPLFPGLFEETCLYSQRLKGWLLRMSGTDVGVERPLNEQSLAEAAATLSQRVYGKFSVGWARAWIPEEEVLNSSKHSTKAFVWEEVGRGACIQPPTRPSPSFLSCVKRVSRNPRSRPWGFVRLAVLWNGIAECLHRTSRQGEPRCFD